METVVAVAIAVLATVFIGSLIALILVCHHRYFRKIDFITQQQTDSRPELHLIDGLQDTNDVELDDVCLHPNIEKILDDTQWVDDATGLVPHCLAILKTCHQLTERLVTMTMGNVQHQPHQGLWDIIEVAKRISPRVDDVVRSMYPPLDPRLLEARTTALVLSVTHLTLVTKSVCQVTIFDWIKECLVEMDGHLKVLRDAAIAIEESGKSSSTTTSEILQMTHGGNHSTHLS